MLFKFFADLECAQDWSFWRSPKHQGSTIARRQTHQSSFGFGETKLFRSAHDFSECFDLFALLSNQQFRIFDDVDEQHMPNLKLNLLYAGGGHNHFGANKATIFKVSKEPRIKWIARIRLRHEDQASRVRP